MTKTIREWADELPPDVREKFLANLDDKYGTFAATTLTNAILGAFLWFKTPEGNDYWKNVAYGAGVQP